MALDRLGNTPSTGQVYLVAGKIRSISGDELLVVTGPRGEHALRVEDADVVRADDLHAVGYFHGQMLALFNANSGLEVITLHLDGYLNGADSMDSSVYRIPVPRDCRMVDVGIRATTLEEEPTEWTVDVYKNGSLADSAAYTPGTNPNYTTTAVTLGTPIDFNAGDEWHMRASGPTANGMGVFVVPGFETR